MKTIPLTKGFIATIDDDDFDRVNTHKWSTLTQSKNHYTTYAHRRIKIGKEWKHISLHRFLMNPPKRAKVDHIDGNGLNNQKSNLRVCTHAQNLMGQRCHNKHGLKGVTLVKSLPEYRQWMTKIRVEGKLTTVGYYPSMIGAAIAYNVAASKHFGEFARLNPIPFTH